MSLTDVASIIHPTLLRPRVAGRRASAQAFANELLDEKYNQVYGLGYRV